MTKILIFVSAIRRENCMNIYDFAMKMEMDGKQYYLDLIDKAENNGVKALFNIMAQEEQAHYDILKSLKNDVELGSESNVLDLAKNIFELMFEKTDQVKTMLSEDALIHALQLENDSIKFYKDQMVQAENPLEKKVFEKLFTEEKKHYFLVENLLEHITGGLIYGINSAEFQQLIDEKLE